jgi:hypothetical protein
VVKVLRPLRSVRLKLCQHTPPFFCVTSPAPGAKAVRGLREKRGRRTLDTDVNVAALVRLLYLSGVFIGFGEGVCERRAG